jgi:putative membrane protein insertion efficiency factor
MNQRGRLHILLAQLARAPGLAGRALVQGYRHTLAGLVGYECRHLPTCSAYADEAIARFGLWAGGWMTLARLCRCHPLGTFGLDFVPPALPAPARWYLPWRYGRWRGTNSATESASPGLQVPRP